MKSQVTIAIDNQLFQEKINYHISFFKKIFSLR